MMKFDLEEIFHKQLLEERDRILENGYLVSKRTYRLDEGDRIIRLAKVTDSGLWDLRASMKVPEKENTERPISGFIFDDKAIVKVLTKWDLLVFFNRITMKKLRQNKNETGH